MTVIIRNMHTESLAHYENIASVQSAKDGIAWFAMTGKNEVTVTVWRNASITLQSTNDSNVLWVRGE